jgi:DNA-binding MarR family transcriptional regulator
MTTRRESTARRARRPRGRTSAAPRGEHLAVSAWLRLLKVKALLEREIRRELNGFTLPQFDVLNQLARRPDGITFVELSRQLLVTAGNLTGIVDRLERERLVLRQPHPADRRAFRLTLTPKGWKKVSAALPVHNDAVARLMAALPQRDLRELRAMLGRLRERLEEGASPRPDAWRRPDR